MITFVLVAPLAALLDCVLLAAACGAAARNGIRMHLTEPAVFAALALSVLAQALLASAQPDAWHGALAVATLGCVAVCGITDWKSGYIFDAVSIPTLLLVVAIGIEGNAFTSVLFGMLCAGGSLLALYAGTRGRGIGLGDVKVAFCIGAGLGPAPAMLSLAIAFVIGGVYAVFLLLRRRACGSDEVRFAPYIAAGTLAAMLAGVS